MLHTVLFMCVSISFSVESLQTIQTQATPPTESNTEVGSPLFLTPLLRKGLYKRAQRLARVNPDIGNITSYSGFLTVNEECESNLFFWFFPAQKADWKQAPLVLWLDGGPGGSSLSGLFNELGPFEYLDGKLGRVKYSWNDKNNLVFIDQPVGVGFSFTGKGCYPRDGTHVGADLYEAVVQLHQLFPNFQRNKFFISGVSYAGHYIPALGHTIHKNNPRAKVKINLEVMMIGNGWFDPVIQEDYGLYYYQHGLIDDSEKEILNMLYGEFVKSVKHNLWGKSAYIDYLMMEAVLNNFVGNVSIYNYESPLPYTHWDNFLRLPKICKALHVGNLPYTVFSGIVEVALASDDVHSVKAWVEELLETYPIIFYNGQLDAVCPYPMMIKFLRSLSWSGAAEYLNATRTKWCVGDVQAGYYKGSHNLYDLLVRNAGHRVEADQSHWAYLLVNSVTSGTRGNPLHALTPC